MTEIYAYNIISEGAEKVLRINYEGSPYTPSLEDDAMTMHRTFDILLKAGHASKIVYVQKEEFLYDEAQTAIFMEIVNVYNRLVNEQSILEFAKLDKLVCAAYLPKWKEFLSTLLLHNLKEDPIGAYVRLVRAIREEQVQQKVIGSQEYSNCSDAYLAVLQHVATKLKETRLISRVAPKLAGHELGNRALYKEIFKPSIRPYFMYTKLVTAYPAGAQEVESYAIKEGTKVLILRVPDDVRYAYHIVPPEFQFTEGKYDLLGAAREIMAEHHPQKSEFIDPEQTREVFLNIGKDLLRDIAKEKGVTLSFKELELLAHVLLRYTIGFGLIEVLLSDPRIQDIVVNAPLGTNVISVIHADYGECRTNITVMPREGESWATKLRLLSGRPLDEANPVLDTDLSVPGGKARVAVIQRPLSPTGLAYAFRRHRDRPWTLPLFIKQRMITPLAAGLLSFLVDGSRTMLIAGTRSAGKTSLLSAIMVELMRSCRIVVIEDTLELPVSQMRKLDYDILSMKVRSVITASEAEVPAEQGIRTALRLGDSALIVGEVRSKEALALYEAMRVGALAKIVAGTIHGDSPYGVFDRVVNDLGVPKTSFKATDVIVVANPIKSASGMTSNRRVTQITEVRKLWVDDPLLEKGFADLMTYNAMSDALEPTEALAEGESEILKAIGASVKEWAGDWDAIWANIELRAKIKQSIVEAADKLNNPELLEAEFVVESNDKFHQLSDTVKDEVGSTDPKRIYNEWGVWFKSKLKST